MQVTLATMRERVRARADMKNSQFVEDSELNQYINSSYQELYDLLVSTFEDYYTLPPVIFSIASGSSFDLPTDFYKLRGIDANVNGEEYYTVLPFDFAQRNRQGQSLNRIGFIQHTKNYRIVGSKVFITPQDQGVGAYRLWYIPTCTTLALDSSTLDGINGWEEYIVVDAARKCLDKEESDTRALVNEKIALAKRINEAAIRRDAGMPKKIVDINLINLDDFWKY
jgi:hypothetical protein